MSFKIGKLYYVQERQPLSYKYDSYYFMPFKLEAKVVNYFFVSLEPRPRASIRFDDKKVLIHLDPLEVESYKTIFKGVFAE